MTQLIQLRGSKNKANQLTKNIADHTEAEIQRYRMVTPGEELIVATSGGKDSLLLLRTLQDLGYRPMPVIVDLGYEKFNAARVAQTVRAKLHLTPQIVKVRDPKFQAQLDEKRREALTSSLAYVDNVPTQASPCTGCYAAKTVGLEAAVLHSSIGNGGAVAFGHHLTDATASLLKSAAYVEDYKRNQVFDPRQFRETVHDWMPNATAPLTQWAAFFQKINIMVEQYIAGTDEPPVEQRNGVRFIRPFFGIPEGHIRAAFAPQGIQVEGSGCSHVLSTYWTPREVIHYGLLQQLEGHPDHDAIYETIAPVLRQQLTIDGTLNLRVRNEREKLLPGYRPFVTKE